MGHGTGFSVANQLPECLEHRVIGFLSAEALDTVSARKAQLRIPDRPLVESVNQGCLPYSCVALSFVRLSKLIGSASPFSSES